MNESILLKRPGMQVGDHREFEARFEVEPFDLYGRHHEVREARAGVAVTRLPEGLYLGLEVSATVETSCDRTLEPVELRLEFGDSEFLPGPNEPELSVEDWTLNLKRYAEAALPSEVPMQVFCPGTEPVRPDAETDEVDPRWRGLDDLFASGF